MYVFFSLRLQDAYSFWMCSQHLPLYLTPRPPPPLSTSTSTTAAFPTSSSMSSTSSTSQARLPPVRLEACGSVCREVERRCPFFILGDENDKAAGNPSFICKDEYIPPVLHSDIHYSHCCYKSVPDPAPGDWLSINATQTTNGFNSNLESGSQRHPFCVEPDSDEVETGSSTTAERPPGWPGLRGLGDDDDPDTPPLRQCSALFHPPGDAGLAVSGVAQDEWGAWHHHLSNDSIESAVLAVSVDDETDAALRRLHDLLDREHLLFWNVARFFGLVDDASSYGTKSALPSPMLILSLVLFLLMDANLLCLMWKKKRRRIMKRT